MAYTYFDKDEIKQSLKIEQVFELVANLGGEPVMQTGFFISRTICHHKAGEGSHKLYYYDNTKLFKCFTECEPSTFDIFQLIIKINHCDLASAVTFIANYFNFATAAPIQGEINEDWSILNQYKANQEIQEPQIVQLIHFDQDILTNLPHPEIKLWETEGISQSIISNRGIAYDPKNEGIVIPHYDIDGNLIGIRERTLIQEEEEKIGKYRPMKLGGQMYNHPLSFNLYNLNNSKNNVKIIRKAIVFESEKSCLKYASYFGEENDISVAVCGSSLSTYQLQLLLSVGVEEVVIAFDKQFQQLQDEEHKKWSQKLKNLNDRYKNLIQLSYMFDKQNLLGYKDSPIDKGADIFMQLFEERIFL